MSGTSFIGKPEDLRIIHMSGPGDACQVLRNMANGLESDDVSHVAYSRLVFEVARDLGAHLLSVSTHGPRDDFTYGRMRAVSRPDPTAGKSGIGFHLANIRLAMEVRRDVAEFSANVLLSVPADMSAQDIVARYKSLADIERGFHVLKSEIEIAPVFHRLPDRIRAHASICFMALVMHRVMRQRLKLAGSTLSPDAALRQLRRVQRHQVRIDGAQPIAGISTIHQDQADTLEALKVKKPSLDAQMSLL